MKPEQISLYYTDGNSDKVYHTQLKPQDDGFIVTFQYGRRGSTLQAGTKTATPVTYDKAKKIYDKLVAEKKGKGYTEGKDGTPYQGTEKAGLLSGLVPQLLNVIDDPAEYINDDTFFAQEKKDGVRLMVYASQMLQHRVIGSNKKGLIVPLSKEIEDGILQFLTDGVSSLTVDGEAIDDVYWIFDILELDGQNVRQLSAWDRYLTLLGMFAMTDKHPAIRFVQAEAFRDGKQLLFEELRLQRAEGLVFKKKTAPYVPGRPASGGNQLKWKFKASATCQVVGGKLGKRSVAIAVRDKSDVAPEGTLVGVGNVTIPANAEIPAIGTLIEVEYLYAYQLGSLFQPVYKGLRPDQESADFYDSLKFKQDTGNDDEG